MSVLWANEVVAFGAPGIPELLIILVIVMLIFGAGKLPQIGEALGKGIKNFKKASQGEDAVDVTPDTDKKELPEGGGAAIEDVEVEEVASSKPHTP